MIGIFDSGSGGLTVLRALEERAPNADIVYFADLANMPYGEKSPTELWTLSKKAIEILIQKGATQIVSACNSVSAQVLLTLLKEYNGNGIHIIEMVTPTAKALSSEKNSKVLLVGTEATVSSNIYKQALKEKGVALEQIAIPPLAEAIEKKLPEEEIQKILETHLASALSNRPDILILGCTQYPLAQKSFETFFAGHNLSPRIFDPAFAVAEEVAQTFNTTGSGKIRFLSSKDTHAFRNRVQDFFFTHDASLEIVSPQ